MGNVTEFGDSVVNGSWRQVLEICALLFRDVGTLVVGGCLWFACLCTLWLSHVLRCMIGEGFGAGAIGVLDAALPLDEFRLRGR